MGLKKRRMLRWWEVAVPLALVLAAVGYVGYRWWKPPVRLVWQQMVAHPASRGRWANDPAIGGFYAEDTTSITFRSWTTGAALWSIPDAEYFVSSPSGAYVATHDMKSQTLTFRHNGVKTGSFTLPPQKDPRDKEKCLPLDDGRTIVILWHFPQYQVFMIRDGTVIARGTYQASTTPDDDEWTAEVAIAPDGAGVLINTETSSTYVLLTIVGSECHFRVRDHPRGSDFSMAPLFPGAVWVDQDGAIGLPGGTGHVPPGFQIDNVLPGSPYAAGGYDAKDGLHVMAVAPATGDHWGVTLPDNGAGWDRSDGADCTPDGKYLLVMHDKPTPEPFLFQWLNEHVPWVKSRTKQSEQGTALLMYRRPGTLTARVYLKPASWRLTAYWPAPDGHGVVAYFGDENVGKWQLYRW